MSVNVKPKKYFNCFYVKLCCRSSVSKTAGMKTIFTTSLLIVASCMAMVCRAQMVTGKVLGEKGRAASNISVNFLNKSNTVLTNADGSFRIMATKLPDTLVFSAVGFEPYKVVVTEKTLKDPNFEVVLLSARATLDDVVVTGYATTKKKDMTGSTASVSEKLFYSSSAGEALTGRVAGVSVSDKTATPPSIRIRGSSSMGGADREYSKASYAKSTPSLLVSTGKKVIFTDSITLKKEGKTYTTRLLTAGEINDYKKWKMWEDFTESDFKSWSEHWDLYAKQRYCVQLTNQNFYAIVGQEVYLIDQHTKDTVWKAVTDNTGKAELWSNFNQWKKEAGKYIIASKGYENIASPMTFENGINRMSANIACSNSKTVDIAFVVDATGSMGDEIEYLKVELEDVLNKTFEQYKNYDLHAASVFYRDKGDQYITKHIDFNTDLLKVLNFIKLQSAGGGGDFPEAVHSALRTAIDSLHWDDKAAAKILFLILDAPPHSEVKNEMFYLIQKAAAKGIRIVPIVCSGADKNTEFIMRSIALATNGTYVFLTDNSAGVGGVHLKPTTDVYNVELLNNLMPRIIQQMLYTNSCVDEQQQEQPIVKVQPNVLEVKVFPNPTRGEVNIKCSKELKEVFVADFTGKILMRLSSSAKQKKWQLNIGSYPAGTYIIKYITSENEWGAERVILIH
jgi:hypothetical protein